MNKYGAQKTEVDGILFDSKAEARHYQKLKLLERAGRISDLKLQVPFDLIPRQKLGGRTHPAVRYKADFTYVEDGRYVVEDVKGMITPVYRLKRRLMLEKYGIEVQEVFA